MGSKIPGVARTLLWGITNHWNEGGNPGNGKFSIGCHVARIYAAECAHEDRGPSQISRASGKFAVIHLVLRTRVTG